MHTAELELGVVKEMATNSMKDSIALSFSTMAGMEAVIGTGYHHTPGYDVRRSVAGVIGWAGSWNGTGILECSPEFACHLANLMLGTEGTELNEDALDAVAEMANIIFGSMKTTLEPRLGRMWLSTPTVIYGNEMGIRSSGEVFTVVPVKIDEHTLEVKVFIAKVEENSNPLRHCWAASSTGAL